MQLTVFQPQQQPGSTPVTHESLTSDSTAGLPSGNPFLGLLQGILDSGDGSGAQGQVPSDILALASSLKESGGNANITDILSQLTPDQIAALQDLSGETGLLPPVLDLSLTINASDITDQVPPTIYDTLLLDGASLGNQKDLLNRIMAQISTLQEEGGASGVLFNLTPEQMVQLQSEIAAALESGELANLPEGMGVLVSIVPPKNEDELANIHILPFVKSQEDLEGINPEVLAQLNDLLKRVQDRNFDDLLAIRTSEEKFSALLKNAASMNSQVAVDVAGETATTLPPPPPASGKNAQPPVDFSKPNLAQAQQGSQGGPASDGEFKGAEHTPRATTPSGPIEGLPLPEGSFLASLGIDDGLFTGIGMPGSSGTHSALAGLQDLTNASTQARHASQPHPSTAIVASTLRQATGLEGNRTLILQLDPPELGRVEVRMEFGADKTLKTTVISEKPDAHFMLQRDSQALERAMQQTGIDADGSSLSFELADDGQGFSHDGRHDGGRNQARNGGSGDEDLDIIETSMTWQVDPETGHMHYNILA